jgi:membrane dipeptidase
MRRGATDDQVHKLVGRNILRVWRENEKVAAQVQKMADSRPIESYWEGRAQPTWEGSLPTLKPSK